MNQGGWVGVLEQMGYRRTLLIEVPVPSDGRPAGLVQAVELLGKAQEHILHGRDRDTVAACRVVLEAIAAALGDTEQGDSPTSGCTPSATRRPACCSPEVPLEVVSEILGHASIAITGNIYGRVSPEVARRAMDVVGEALDR